MDQRLQYEQLIGTKLEGGLSIPNMEDMIWARVKAQLDIDLPTDEDGGGDDGPQSPIGRGPLRWAIPAVVIALISIFFLFKNKPATTENTSSPIITQPVNEPPSQATGPPPAINEIITPAPRSPQVTTTPGASPVDSSSGQQVLTPPITGGILDSIKTGKPDSLFTFTPPPVKTDTIPAKKKGKGVSGLKDDDYRIVPKGN
jgi:hypothetical protein